MGDKVQIEMTRPISKTKSYALVKILEKSHGTVELKENVTEVKEEKKVGADEIAREKAAKEAEKEAETTKPSAEEVTAETEEEKGDK